MSFIKKFKSQRESMKKRRRSNKIAGAPVKGDTDKIVVEPYERSTYSSYSQSPEVLPLVMEKEAVPSSSRFGLGSTSRQSAQPPPSFPDDGFSTWRAPYEFDPPTRPSPPRWDEPPVKTGGPTKVPARGEAKALKFKILWIVGAILIAAFGGKLIQMLFSSKPPPPPQVLSNFDHSRPVIAIMGGTGTGKSSFIHALGGQDENGSLPVIGHTLKSCTKQTTRYSASIRDLNFYVLDTPGFDDTAISDSTILQDLATELAWLHRSGGKLAGLVYLHDISRPRMGRVGEKNLLLFKKLVGEKSLRNVVLATTHWPSTPTPETRAHEADLKSYYWSHMIRQGSRVARHNGGPASAKAIVASLIYKPGVVVKIVDELVGQNLRFDQTDAGAEVDQALGVLRAEMKRANDALARQLKEAEETRKEDARKAEVERRSLEKKMTKAAKADSEKAKAALKVTIERLEKERVEREDELKQLRKEREGNKQKAADAKKQERQMRRKLKNELKAELEPFIWPLPSRGPIFMGVVCWLIESCIKVVALFVVFLGPRTPETENRALFVLVDLFIYWLIFSYFFFAYGPHPLGIFVAVSHCLYRIFKVSNIAGYQAGHHAGESKALEWR